MEEGNDSSFELGTFTSVDCGRWERLPDDSFADVGSDEQRNTEDRIRHIESKTNLFQWPLCG